MALLKTSIAVPAELLAGVDRIAQERGESRNRFVVRVLTKAVNARSDAQITQTLNELFADEDARSEQTAMAQQLESATVEWVDREW